MKTSLCLPAANDSERVLRRHTNLFTRSEHECLDRCQSIFCWSSQDPLPSVPETSQIAAVAAFRRLTGPAEITVNTVTEWGPNGTGKTQTGQSKIPLPGLAAE